MLSSQIQATSISNGPMWTKVYSFALNSFLFAGALHAGSVTLINDSHFPLIGQIFNAAGDHRGSVNLSPGQTYMWYDNESSFGKQYDEPTTPFTVRFLCPKSRAYDYSTPPKKKEKRASYQSEFGSWSNVPTGATVNALGVDGGTKSCVIKDKSKQDLKPASRKYKNEGFNNWSNDGGETWQNNSGPGWENNDFINPSE